MRVRTAVMTATEKRLLAEGARRVRILGDRTRSYTDIPPLGFKGTLTEGLLGLLGWLFMGEGR